MHIYVALFLILNAGQAFTAVPDITLEEITERCSEIDPENVTGCTGEVERMGCNAKGLPDDCVRSDTPYAYTISQNEYPSTELCTLLETEEGREAAVHDAPRLRQIYAAQSPRILSSVSSAYECNTGTCYGDQNHYYSRLDKLAIRAPDLYIWANAAACGHVSLDTDFSAFEQYTPSPNINSHQLYNNACSILRTQEGRASLTEADMWEKYEPLMLHTAVLKIKNADGTELHIGGKLSRVMRQTLACGWYGRKGNYSP